MNKPKVCRLVVLPDRYICRSVRAAVQDSLFLGLSRPEGQVSKATPLLADTTVRGCGRRVKEATQCWPAHLQV